MKQRISVVMATYNGQQFVREQLDSIFAQTMLVDEIIIYDDCSSDDTLKIVKSYQLQDDIKIHIFSQTQRVGYIQNFASGLRMSNADVIFLCDQDDVWEKDKVARMMKLFDTYEDILCINTSFTYIDEVGKQISAPEANAAGYCWEDIKENSSASISFDEICYHNIAMGCTMAFRSQIKDIYLRQSSFQAAHDWEINAIAAMNNGLVFYHRNLIKYRIHKDNTTGNDKLKKEASSGAQTREKNAVSLLDFAKGLLKYQSSMDDVEKENVLSLVEFHETRLALLQTGQKKYWFSLLRHYGIYKNIVSKKGMMADVFYHGRK